MKIVTRTAPPDQRERERALDAARSILVQAPAGSGKTDLLTRRFLRLLGEVNEPGQIVAITFTKAAAAEMRNRILSELEKAASRSDEHPADDEFAMEVLARRALERSRALGWNLIDLPAQLRISTIDSFCRELALQQPLLSGLGGGLDITENPSELYHRAARSTLEQIGKDDAGLNTAALNPAIEALLLWRDNGWQEMENLLVSMLEQRDRWMQDFVLTREPDWDALRERLERPFARAVAEAMAELDELLDQETRDEAMELARFSCGQKNKWLQCKLFQFAGLPCQPFASPNALEEARQGYMCLAQMLLTGTGTFRQRITASEGFPTSSPDEKRRILDLIDRLGEIDQFESKLCSVRDLPPARYTEEDWQIVRACFTLLRHAAGELQVAFAEAGAMDFAEVAHIAQRVLRDEDGGASDAAIAIADKIQHLLVDEFQDTSRRQHKLIGALVAGWPDFEGRTLFVVGDPMQSIYFFRDADAELFPRVREVGLELPNGEMLRLRHVPLSSNFRTAPQLVETLNDAFAQIFAVNDGSGVRFAHAEPARNADGVRGTRFQMHLGFVPQTVKIYSANPDVMQRKQDVAEQRIKAQDAQVAEIVSLVRGHMERLEDARTRGEKYRIAVLGRARKALEPIARALHDAGVPFRAVELEKLAERPEVLDALALARALFNPEDRVAWLGVLRAPWCGLSLTDLHTLTSGDNAEVLRKPVPELLRERQTLLSPEGLRAAERVLNAVAAVPSLRAAQPTAGLGTWLEQVWLRLGGSDCVDATGRANCDLLWKCLDQLKEGEPDLLGAGLAAALEKLTAQPDPNASSDHGVQLMSIHKSKGLEFEVVIVPELQAKCGTTRMPLLSWLERGLATMDESGDITEFLVAPLPSKGAERGKSKQWVDRVYRARESQEMRRILYVAATRAREELHLFARPEYKTDNNHAMTLCEPSGSLLATAWPALEEEVRAQFEEWTSKPQEERIEAIAAASATNVVVMPSPAKPAKLRRLPPDYEPALGAISSLAGQADVAGLRTTQLYARHEGGLISRARGRAVHALMEELARQRTAHDWEATRVGVERILPRIMAELRAAGVELNEAGNIANQALDIALRASEDATAQWILSPHNDAASEVRWAGVIAGSVREVRVDRVFRAGETPGSRGDGCWWIVDYKTAQADGDVAELRRMFAAQLELYAEVLRNLHGKDTNIRAGLYYPRKTAFDWWEL
jgi:ATP-dependent exoDNAse (exonuclease V) beta subunit